MAKTTIGQVPGGSPRVPLPDGIRSAADPSSPVRLHHDITDGCGHCGFNHQCDQNSDALAPAEAAYELILDRFLPSMQDLRPDEREVGPAPIGLEI